jgi:expansin (peptidoglycan-binding protein)
MDGIFCAYHNTAKIFGFQYIPLEDMDQALFGSSTYGTQAYQISLKLMGTVLKEVIKKLPEQVSRNPLALIPNL